MMTCVSSPSSRTIKEQCGVGADWDSQAASASLNMMLTVDDLINHKLQTFQSSLLCGLCKCHVVEELLKYFLFGYTDVSSSILRPIEQLTVMDNYLKT